jgi:hypothetical protein
MLSAAVATNAAPPTHSSTLAATPTPHASSSPLTPSPDRAASRVSAEATTRFTVFLWGCASHLWEPIRAAILAYDGRTASSKAPKVGDPRHRSSSQPLAVAALSTSCELQMRDFDELATFVRGVYEVDDASPTVVGIKIDHLRRCSPRVLTMNLTTTTPAWALKSNGKSQSGLVIKIKAEIRTRFKKLVANYTHDIIIHIADNEAVHTRFYDRMLASRVPAACNSSMAAQGPSLSTVAPPLSAPPAFDASGPAAGTARGSGLQCREVCSLGYPTLRGNETIFCELADSNNMPLNFELPQAQCTRECCGTFRPHMDIDEDSQTVIAVPPELVLPLPDRDEFVRTAALAVIQRLGPDVTLLLSLIYDLPHAVIKVDSQPPGFPAAIKLGGDVDILTTEASSRALIAAVTSYFAPFRARGGPFRVVVVDTTPGEWKIRLMERDQVVFMIHITWRALDRAALAVEMLSRRQRMSTGAAWVLAPADERTLREADCRGKNLLAMTELKRAACARVAKKAVAAG